MWCLGDPIVMIADETVQRSFLFFHFSTLSLVQLHASHGILAFWIFMIKWQGDVKCILNFWGSWERRPRRPFVIYNTFVALFYNFWFLAEPQHLYPYRDPYLLISKFRFAESDRRIGICIGYLHPSPSNLNKKYVSSNNNKPLSIGS